MSRSSSAPGEALRAEDLGPFVEGQIGGDHDGAPLVALAEEPEEQLGRGAEQGHKTQFVYDQQVEQPSFVPGLQRSALPRLHRYDAPSWFPSQGGYLGFLRGYDHLSVAGGTSPRASLSM